MTCNFWIPAPFIPTHFSMIQLAVVHSHFWRLASCQFHRSGVSYLLSFEIFIRLGGPAPSRQRAFSFTPEYTPIPLLVLTTPPAGNHSFDSLYHRLILPVLELLQTESESLYSFSSGFFHLSLFVSLFMLLGGWVICSFLFHGRPHNFSHRPWGGHLGYLTVLMVTNKAAGGCAVAPRDGGFWPRTSL